MPKPKAIFTTEGGTIQHRDLVVDPKTKGLRSVVVVLEGAPVQPKVEGVEPVLMDQRDMVFLPRVVAVRHGQAVRFDNSDSCNHSVMAVSKVPANQFNLFVLQGKPIEHVFEPQERPVVIGCSLHEWMRAWVYVFRHPWFAVTDEQGRFGIRNIPPGKHTLLLAHPDTNRRERRAVEVKPGGTVRLNIEWTEPK